MKNTPNVLGDGYKMTTKGHGVGFAYTPYVPLLIIIIHFDPLITYWSIPSVF